MRFNLHINAFGAADAIEKRIVNRRIARDFRDRARVNGRFDVREEAPRRAIGGNNSHVGVDYDEALMHFIYGRIQ